MIRFIAALLIGLMSFISTSEATKSDVYRDALRNKSFTLKYEILTPPVHKTNRSGVLKYGNILNPVVFTGNESIKYSGIVVVNGNDKYVETVSEKDGDEKTAVGICKLTKNDEIFNFYWDMKKGQQRYYGGKRAFGGKSTSVRAEDSSTVDPYRAMFQEYNYGSPTLTKALFVIMPKDKIIESPNMPKYKFFGSATLDNGLTCEDYYSNSGDKFHVARYYFDGDKLIKIATASYTKRDGVIVDYEKSVIGITEFSFTPEQKYLSLPEGIKDKTKRDTKGDSK